MLMQIKIIFSFMDHINMRKEYLWDCPFPGQYSRTFYRIWKVNFQKASSQSRALTLNLLVPTTVSARINP